MNRYLGTGLVYGSLVRFVPLFAFALALGCDGSMTSPRAGDGGLCGAEGNSCCGVDSCDDGLACLAGTCTSSTCGGAYQACCTAGMDCGPGLTCDRGFCSPESARPDGGPPISDCGAEGLICCSGDTCDTGNLCVAGTCRREVPIPMCTPTGGACTASADCCSMSCSGGTCSSGGPPPPPPPSCGSAFSCYDCTLDSECGWCDGTCTAITNRAGCTDFRTEILDCLL